MPGTRRARPPPGCPCDGGGDGTRGSDGTRTSADVTGPAPRSPDAPGRREAVPVPGRPRRSRAGAAVGCRCAVGDHTADPPAGTCEAPAAVCTAGGP